MMQRQKHVLNSVYTDISIYWSSIIFNGKALVKSVGIILLTENSIKRTSQDL